MHDRTGTSRFASHFAGKHQEDVFWLESDKSSVWYSVDVSKSDSHLQLKYVEMFEDHETKEFIKSAIVQADDLSTVDGILDIFGRVGEDGAGTDHDFRNARVVRKVTFRVPNFDNYNPNNWYIYRNSNNDVDDSDPNEWDDEGPDANRPPLTRAPTSAPNPASSPSKGKGKGKGGKGRNPTRRLRKRTV